MTTKLMDTLANMIMEHPFWKGLKSEHFPLLIEGARLVRFAAGTTIAQEGQETERFYLILRGEVALETRLPEPVTIQTIGAGEGLGWSWLFAPFHWHFDARAVPETEAIVWETSQLRAKAEANPAFGYDLACRMIRLLLQRLHATHRQLVDFYGPQG